MKTTLELKEFVRSLYADEAAEIETLLPSVINSKEGNGKIINRERKKSTCPFCKSEKINKNGKKEGQQRYGCKDCGKFFSDTTNSIVFRSKFTYDQWIKFIHCEINNYSLKNTANYVGVSQTTAFAWRHKIYKAIEEVKKSIILSGEIEIDSTFFAINLKGTKRKNMPRLSKKRGTSAAYRGVSHHKVCVMSAVDENDNMFFEITGLGSETNEMTKKIRNKIGKCKRLISDGSWVYQTLAEELKSINEVIKSKTYTNERGYNLSTLNGLHSELKTSLKQRKGVSIKHLQGYLDMFLFKKMLNYKVEIADRDKMAYKYSVPNQTKMFIREIFEKAVPIDLYAAYREYNHSITESSHQHLS